MTQYNDDLIKEVLAEVQNDYPFEYVRKALLAVAEGLELKLGTVTFEGYMRRCVTVGFSDVQFYSDPSGGDTRIHLEPLVEQAFGLRYGNWGGAKVRVTIEAIDE